MPEIQKEPKIYGAIVSDNRITFTGFCKKLYNPIPQKVEVFIDGNKINSILANEKIDSIQDSFEVFDTHGFCFTYKLPQKYMGTKHKLEFKTTDGEQLLSSPLDTFDKFNPAYNQALFIESLRQKSEYNVLKQGYRKNTLSFIAIEENLHDKAFVEYVFEICKIHKELELNLIYFNDVQKKVANKVFKKLDNKRLINLSNIEDLIKNSEIYLHNEVEKFVSTTNGIYYNKVKNTNAMKDNLFVIELTQEIKSNKGMAQRVVNENTPILFETSIMAEIFRNEGKGKREKGKEERKK